MPVEVKGDEMTIGGAVITIAEAGHCSCRATKGEAIRGGTTRGGVQGI